MTSRIHDAAAAALPVFLALAALGVGAPPAQAGLLDDIKKKKEIAVATEAGYAPFEFVEGGKSLTEIKEYASGYTEIYADIDNGRIDAAPNGLPNLAWLMKQQPGKYKLAGQLGERTYFAWATRKEDQDVLEYLNVQLLKLKKAGTLNELQMKWFGFTMELPDVPTLMK